MLWLSLIPCRTEHAVAAQQRALSWWALQFTPRVALLEEAVVFEVSGSLRLFGGARHLLGLVRSQAGEQGFHAVASAPTSRGALALSRQGGSDAQMIDQASPAGGSTGGARSWQVVLDALPLEALTSVASHQATLARLGCQTLGDVRRLPRGGMARRFGAGLLQALDQAYGNQPEQHVWETLPEVFDERLELPFRVTSTEAILHAARHLLGQLETWLAARRAGVRAIVLRWRHDMASQAAGEGGELEVRTAEPVREVDHLGRLLGEHLAKVELQGPVGEIMLHAHEIAVQAEQPLSLLPDAIPSGEAFQQALERLSARLGESRVQRPVLLDDHRPGHMQDWRPAASPAGCSAAARPSVLQPHHLPLPAWLLELPQPLPMRGNKPVYQGLLTLLAGPHRIESGWWDRRATGQVVRDYFIASSPQAGLVWVYRERWPGDAGHSLDAASHWYLHGLYG
ncbi:MAG: DNA polymerase Y family protein [Rubrivivax sp.]|nr:MAG: DNA polymerase Y family protein [Rubrivivax sp.]